jgi:hypothetical protein
MLLFGIVFILFCMFAVLKLKGTTITITKEEGLCGVEPLTQHCNQPFITSQCNHHCTNKPLIGKNHCYRHPPKYTN